MFGQKSELCRWIRHPAYCGWLIWSVGTQVLLVNPICAVIFFLAVGARSHHRPGLLQLSSVQARILAEGAQTPICRVQAWRFFKLRVGYEDRLLQSFFGDDFLRYRQRTPSGLPLI